VSQQWPNLTLHFNGAVSRTRAHEFGRFASVIAEGPDRWPVRPVAELAVERDGEETPSRGLIVGVLWETRARLTIDGGARIAYADEHEIELRAGLTWNKHVAKPAILKKP
jgi:hypothetical protein